MKKILKNNLLLILIVAFGAFLRFWQLGAYSLWKDEIFSMIEAQKSLIDIFTKKTYFFGYTPFHHFITHVALYFGKTEFIVRFPAVLFGIGSIYLIYKLGNSLFGKRVGLISAFLLAISPFHLEYSREVRYYSYLIFFSALSLFFLHKFLFGKRKIWLILFILTTLLNIMTQATALLVLGSQIMFFLIWIGKKQDKKSWSKRMKFKGNFFFLAVIFLLTALSSLFIKSFSDLVLLTEFKTNMKLFDFFKYFFISLSGERSIHLFYLPFFILGLIFTLKKKKESLLFLFLIFVLPPLILYNFRPEQLDFHIRYVSFAIIPYLLFIAVGLNNFLKQKLILTPALLLLMGISFRPIQNYYQTTKGDWRGVGEYLISNTKLGDVIITENNYNKILLDYYLESEKHGLILKTSTDSLTHAKIPFRIYFLQHDYVTPKKSADPEKLPLIDYEKIIAFDYKAKTSTMYLFVSQPIYFWQEGESDWIDNKGWNISDFWGQKTISADSLNFPNAEISYKINIPQNGTYDLYANLRWDGARGVLKYKFDSGKWSEDFRPFYGEKGDVTSKWRWKEVKLSSNFIESGQHKITFLNEKTKDENDRYQTIDYFYLTLNPK